MTLAVNIAQGGSNNVTMRNRLINGQMQVAQRGTSFSQSASTLNAYTLDRWFVAAITATTTASQSTNVPTGQGFINSLFYSIGATTATPSSGNNNYFNQVIEAANVADFQIGTAYAKTVTVSFWVRASATGTYCMSLTNGGGNNNSTPATRSYVTTFSISAADTWTQITKTVTLDTAGTWNSGGAGIGLTLIIDFGSGTNRQTSTLNAWQTGDYCSTSGAVQLTTIANATMYITGLQLEAGTTASPFEYRQYGTELFLCQRYYAEIPNTSGTSTGPGRITGTVNGPPGNPIVGNLYLPVPMRAAPGVTAYGGGKSGSGSISTYSGGSGGQVTYNTNVSGLSVPFISANTFALNLASIGSTQSGYGTWTDMGWASSQLAFVASAEL
jgi:hypothetical protein